jgi:hypothetical protein
VAIRLKELVAITVGLAQISCGACEACWIDLSWGRRFASWTDVIRIAFARWRKFRFLASRRLLEPDEVLKLYAEMVLPGKAWLEFTVEQSTKW